MFFTKTLSPTNKTIQENESTSELVLPKCVFAYNSSKQSTTRYSPFFLMYWRNPVLPNQNASHFCFPRVFFLFMFFTKTLSPTLNSFLVTLCLLSKSAFCFC
jgi:hypothetical protein